MLELVLPILGLFAAFRRPALKRLAAADFPEADAAAFEAWRAEDLRANKAFPLATWGAFGAKRGLMLLLEALADFRFGRKLLRAIFPNEWYVLGWNLAIVGSVLWRQFSAGPPERVPPSPSAR